MMILCEEIFRKLVYRADRNCVPALYREDYYPYYHRLGHELKPKAFLEIGTRFGYSLIALCRGSYDSGARPAVVSVDLETYDNPFNKETQKIAEENLRACVPEVNAIFVKGDSHEILKGMTDNFDVIHIDGDHTEEGAYQDIADASKLLTPKGVILVDDLDQEQVRRAFDRASKELSWAEIDEIPHFHRLGFLRRGS